LNDEVKKLEAEIEQRAYEKAREKMERDGGEVCSKRRGGRSCRGGGVREDEDSSDDNDEDEDDDVDNVEDVDREVEDDD
jgi:hypothetical protein